MLGNLFSGQPVVFNGTDNPLYIVGVNRLRGFRIDFCQHLVQMLFPFLCRQLFQFLPDTAVVFIFRKVNVVGQCLNVKSGASGHDRHMAAAVNACHGFLRHRLETGYIKLLPGLQHVNEMMGHSLHLLRHDLGRPDVHMAVHLHGIGTDDLAV